ncbi:MAG: hypothetical protein EU549_01345 [Promethearchaeota archaeon]|nr:MAG: hypothetical protein EU549_01345 [Candidatus Lokiarchaeota archaeon]
MVKTLIELKLLSNTKNYTPIKDIDSNIYCELKNRYDFNVEIYGPIYLFILEAAYNKYKCWKLYNIKNKSLGFAVKKVRISLKPDEKKAIFHCLINDLFFNSDHWKWIWICENRKIAQSPIYQDFDSESGFVKKLHFIIELKARLIAKVEIPKPEPEAAWNYSDGLFLSIA